MDLDVRFRFPWSGLVAGPSMSGKTEWAMKLVENIGEMSTVNPDVILWHYSEWQPAYDKLRSIVTFQEGLPDLQALRNDSRNKLLIIDDMLDEYSKAPTELTALFTKVVHHASCSVLHLVQSVFYKNLRIARTNASFLVLFRNLSDSLSISSLARQMYPRRTKFFCEAYDDATKKEFGYLLVDTARGTDDRLRLRTDIFHPAGEVCMVYLPKV